MSRLLQRGAAVGRCCWGKQCTPPTHTLCVCASVPQAHNHGMPSHDTLTKVLWRQPHAMESMVWHQIATKGQHQQGQRQLLGNSGSFNRFRT